MADAHDVLFDDRAIVQLFGDIVACGANQFNASLIGPELALRSNKRGQKGMMDIEDAVAITGSKFGAQNLHVPGQHDQIDPLARQQLQLFPFLFSLMAESIGRIWKGMPNRCAIDSRLAWLLFTKTIVPGSSPAAFCNSKSYRQWLYFETMMAIRCGSSE